jgi:ABC-type multidrug transport system ATPase subunit
LPYHPGVPPLLSAASLRVDVSGTPTVDGLGMSSTGERILVLGAPAALFEAAAGLRRPSRGEIRVEGMAAVDAVRARVSAPAPLDPPMPPRWTARQYVVWSARLAGHARAQASELAAEAHARTRLESVADRRLGVAALAARRATVVAAALATGATTLLIEDPTAGLPSGSALAFSRVLARALADRRTAFFAGRMRLESPIALGADEAIVIAGNQVAAQGAPAELAAAERSFALRVTGDTAAFARAVVEQGARLLTAAPGEAPAGAPDAATTGRVSVELGPLGTRDLLRIARAANATVLELRPISGAFA